MTVSMKSLIEGWDGVGVVTRYDQPTGTWIFIAIHDDTLGTPTGGTRMKMYPSPALGLQDAMRLAGGMTHKWAAVNLGFGGGKAVLAVSGPMEGEQRTGLLTRYGTLLESLHGSFATGCDLGTSPDDMLLISRATQWVRGVDYEEGRSKDPGPYTALGVFVGMQTAVRHVMGSDGLAGKVVHVQGVGDVGAPLARMLKDAGAEVLLSDLDTRRAESLAEELGGAQTFEPHTAYRVPCDVYAPCAVGATLNAETIAELKCRVVAGSANNQLAEPTDAALLHDRGILYAPDYVVNAGGAIAFGMLAQGVKDDAQMRDRIERIADSLDEILEAARSADESPVHAADRIVEQRLEQARS